MIKGQRQKLLNIVNILFLLFLCLSINLNGQYNQLNFQKLNEDHGLSCDESVMYLAQDSKGFVWMSSVDGLNRFDGNEIRVYGFEDGLQEMNVQSSFFEDQSTNIWFTTTDAINCYVRKEDSIHTHRIRDENGEEIVENYKAFYLDTIKNRLWLKAGEYIWAVNINNIKNNFHLPQKTNGFHYSVVYDSQGSPRKILTAPWYGKGISSFEINDTILLEYKEILMDISGLRKTIQLTDSLWFTFTGSQLILFSDKVPSNVRLLNNHEKCNIYDAILLDKDHLLLSSEENGLILYHWGRESFIKNWSFSESDVFGLSSKSPLTINKSNNNYVWVSHQNIGLDYSYLKINPFIKLSSVDGIEVDEINSIHQTPDGQIWCGDRSNKLYRFSSSGSLEQTIDCGKNIGLTNKSWMFFPVDSSSFLMTIDKFIYRISNFENPKLERLIESSDNYFKLMIKVFPERIILSTTNGLQELVKDSLGKHQVIACKEFLEYQKFAFLNIFQSSQQKFYLPYNSNELWVYDVTEAGLKLIKKVQCGLQFFSFFESKIYPNTIWAGTNKGVVKIINDTLIEPAFKENNKLSFVRTYGIIEDLEGGLWIGTNNGLWRYSDDGSKPRFSQFEAIDGLPNNQFPEFKSSLLANDGRIWMGTNKGIVHFKPAEIKVPDNPPNVYLSKLIINDTEEYKGIGEETEIDLPYDKSTLTFEALAISYLKPERSKIHYQLKGFDEQWLQINPDQRVRYTKLPHGKFDLQIQAENAYGQRSDIQKLTINIAPPFWKTWWFMLLCLLASALIMYSLYRYRLRQLLREEEKKTALAQLEAQVLEVEMKALKAQMNPHFLFNAMNSIKGIMLEKDEEKASEYLTKFSLLLRTILEHSEKPLIPLIKELEALELYISIESLRFEREFHYEISIDENVDTGFSEIPPLILQPFVENAIWHGLLPKASGELLLNLRVKREEDFIIIEIEDNGVGRKYIHPKSKPKTRKSFGIEITQKRALLLHPENRLKILDLVTDNGAAAGTKVVLTLYDPE